MAKATEVYSSTPSLTLTLDAPAALLPEETRLPLYEWLDGPQSRPDGREKTRLHRDSIPGQSSL